MRITFTLLLAFLTTPCFAQQPAGTAIAGLDVSNIHPKVLTGGDMFRDLQTNNPTIPGWYNQAFEVPRGSGKHTMFSGALWLGGKDPQSNLYVASQTYRQGSPPQAGYWPGPIGIVQGAAHSAKYDKIWKVSQNEIQYHIQNYNNAGYVAPSVITNWPGNGDAANGEAARLAPFIDLNNDGLYSPAQGEYPNIKGDQALYLILNDKGNVKQPVSNTMNAEVHVLFYGFDTPANGAVFNTLFSEYRIINRGAIPLQDIYAGLWLDLDLGNWTDDYIGCDTTTNRFYCYNGDNDDEGPEGYGLNPPVQSVKFLDQQMSHFMFYNNDNNAVNGNPFQAVHYYNYLRGKWKNNNNVTHGGNGTDQANTPTAYMYPGDPVTATGWSEKNTLSTPAANIPGDRRGLGSVGPFNLMPGQEYKFTVAYTYSRGTSNLNSITVAQQDAQVVQSFFNNNLLALTKPVSTQNELVLFPNPAQDQLSFRMPFSFKNHEVQLTITDYTGRTVLQKNVKAGENLQSLNIAALSKGIYQVSLTSENQIISSKLVKL